MTMTTEEMFFEGKNYLVLKDYVKAAIFFSGAAKGGHTEAKKLLDTLKTLGHINDEVYNKLLMQKSDTSSSSPSAPAPSARSGGSSISLIGTTWGTDPGFHNYQLMGNGILKYAGSNGTWIQNGNSVTLKLGLSTKTEISELQLVDSNTMKGTRRNEYQQSFQDFSGKSYKKGDVEYFDKEVVLKKKGNS